MSYRNTLSGDVVQVGSIRLPKTMVEVERSNVSSGRDMIINIQDCHSSLGMQYSITNVLEELLKNYDINVVGIEGAEGYIDTSLLTACPDKEIKKRTASVLMKKGKLSAGEFFSVLNGHDVALYGVDDKGLYSDDLRVFRKIYAESREIVPYLGELEKRLEKARRKDFPEGLEKFIFRSRLHREGRIGFETYWAAIRPMCVEKKIDLSGYKAISGFIAVSGAEKNIDFSRANIERKKLVDDIISVSDRDEVSAVVVEALRFGQGEISELSYYDWMFKIAALKGINTARYERLLEYISYLKATQEVDVYGVQREVEAVESLILERTYISPSQKKVFEASEAVRFLKQLFSVKLSPSDVSSLKKVLRDTDADDIIKALPAGDRPDKRALSGVIDAAAENIRFYDIAAKRNEAMLANTVEAMRLEGKHAAALITGGHHSEGITDLVKGRGLSYVVLMPRTDNFESRPYVAVLTRKSGIYDTVGGAYDLALEAYFDAGDIAYFDEMFASVLGGFVLAGLDMNAEREAWIGSYRAAYGALSPARKEKMKFAPVKPEAMAERLRSAAVKSVGPDKCEISIAGKLYEVKPDSVSLIGNAVTTTGSGSTAVVEISLPQKEAPETITQEELEEILSRFRQEGDVTTVLIKGGAGAAITDRINRSLAKGYQVSVLDETLELPLSAVLERWGDTGISASLNFIEKEIGEGSDISVAREAVIERDGEKLTRWIDGLHAKYPNARELNALRFCMEYLSRGTKWLILKRKISRREALTQYDPKGEGLAKLRSDNPSITGRYSDEQLRRLEDIGDYNEQDLSKVIVVGATNVFKAHEGSIRHSVSGALAADGDVTAIAAKYGFRMDNETDRKGLIGLICNCIHIPKDEELFKEFGLLTKEQKTRIEGIVAPPDGSTPVDEDELEEIMVRFRQEKDVTTVLVKGGAGEAITDRITLELGKGYEVSLLEETRELPLSAVLERWGDTGISASLKFIEKEIGPGADVEAAREAVARRDGGKLSEWINETHSRYPKARELNALMFSVEYLSRGTKWLILKRKISRREILSIYDPKGEGLAKLRSDNPSITVRYDAEQLKRLADIDDYNEQDLSKVIVVGATNVFKAHEGSIRQAVSGTLAKDAGITAIAAKHGFVMGEDDDRKGLIGLICNCIHIPKDGELDKEFCLLTKDEKKQLDGILDAFAAPRGPSEGMKNIFDVPDGEFLAGLMGDTREHTLRVRAIAMRLAAELGLTDAERTVLSKAITVHDIGNSEKYKYPEALKAVNEGIFSLPHSDRTEPASLDLRKWANEVAPKFASSSEIEEAVRKSEAGNDYYPVWDLYIRKAAMKKGSLTPEEEKVSRNIFSHGKSSLEELDSRGIYYPVELGFLVLCHHDYDLLRGKLIGAIRGLRMPASRVDRIKLMQSVIMAADSFEQGNNNYRLVLGRKKERVENFAETERWLKRRVGAENIDEVRPFEALAALLRREDPELLAIVAESRGTSELFPEDIRYMRESEHFDRIVVGIPEDVLLRMGSGAAARLERELGLFRVESVEPAAPERMLADLEGRTRDIKCISVLLDRDIVSPEDGPEQAFEIAAGVLSSHLDGIKKDVLALMNPAVSSLTEENIGKIRDIEKLKNIAGILLRFQPEARPVKFNERSVYDTRMSRIYSSQKLSYNGSAVNALGQKAVQDSPGGKRFAVSALENAFDLRMLAEAIRERRSFMEIGDGREDPIKDVVVLRDVNVAREDLPGILEVTGLAGLISSEQVILLGGDRSAISPEEIKEYIDKELAGVQYPKGIKWSQMVIGQKSDIVAIDISAPSAYLRTEAEDDLLFIRVEEGLKNVSASRLYRMMVEILARKGALPEVIDGSLNKIKGFNVYIYIPRAVGIDLEVEARKYERYVIEVMVKA